jgi:hypothetical protein
VAPIGATDMWIDPTNGERTVVAHDDDELINRGRSWHHIQLPIAQILPRRHRQSGALQRLRQPAGRPSTRGPSHSRLGKQSRTRKPPRPRGMWHAVAGGERLGDSRPVDNNIVWRRAGLRQPRRHRGRLKRRRARAVRSGRRSPSARRRRREIPLQLDLPLAISPHDHNTVYAGSQHVHRTTNGGQSWQVISPDLTTGDVSAAGLGRAHT